MCPVSSIKYTAYVCINVKCQCQNSVWFVTETYKLTKKECCTE